MAHSGHHRAIVDIRIRRPFAEQAPLRPGKRVVDDGLIAPVGVVAARIRDRAASEPVRNLRCTEKEDA
jgi:hypothetical protein